MEAEDFLGLVREKSGFAGGEMGERLMVQLLAAY
jgi:hypothetical protein